MLPPDRWTRASDALILHGRRICRPKPLCPRCNVRPDCDFYRTGFVTKPAKRAAAAARPSTRTPPSKKKASSLKTQETAAVVTREHFRELVEEAIDSIPERFARHVRNVGFIVEDEPSADLLDEMEVEDGGTLLGLYQGTPLTERQLGSRQSIARSHPPVSSVRSRTTATAAKTTSSGRSARRSSTSWALLRNDRRGDRRRRRHLAAGAHSTKTAEMRARKRFAQHFLEAAWVNKLVAAVAATPDDSILEIGPGRGAITRPLAAQAGRLLAIEIDRDLAAELEAAALPNVTVVTGDVLVRRPACRSSPNWLGAAARTRQSRSASSATFPTTSRRRSCSRCWISRPGRTASATRMLMLQKEVADRLVAKVGTGDYGVLTVLTAVHADVTRVLSLPAGRVSASAQGAFRGRPADVPAAESGHCRPATCSSGWCGRCSPSGGRRSRTPSSRLASSVAWIRSGRWRPRASTRNAGPETLELAEMAALARAFSAPVS